MIDYVISNIAETNILDVFQHNDLKSNNEPDAKPEYEENTNV